MDLRLPFRLKYFLFCILSISVLCVLFTSIRFFLPSNFSSSQTSASPQRSNQIWKTDGRIHSLLYSPDGSILASVETLTQDTEPAHYEVRLRQIPTGKILYRFGGQAERIYSLAFSHDGKLLAAGDQGSQIQIWRVADGSLLATLNGHSEPVQQVVFSPDDTRLLSVSEDYTIREWSIPDGIAQATISWSKYYNCGVAHVAFVKNEPFFVVREVSSMVIYSFPSQEIRKTIQGFERATCTDFERVDVRFNANATSLASVDAFDGRESLIRIWSLNTAEVPIMLAGHTDRIVSVAFSPDDQFIASASGIPYFAMHTNGDLSIRVWQVRDGEPVAIFEKAHYGAIGGLAFSPDNKVLVSGGVDGVIQFWQISS